MDLPPQPRPGGASAGDTAATPRSSLRGVAVRGILLLVNELEFTVVAIDPETGERVSCPITASAVEEVMIKREGLPDPDHVTDDEGDDD